jgi:hypothetical protein
VAFSDGDDEEAQKNIPEIKGELAPEMSANVRGLAIIFAFLTRGLVDAQGPLFVDVGSTD